jgi:M-phase inducer tyrosine phosphatase
MSLCQNQTHSYAESMITPPLPSSSPGPGNDSMDISPLPHKAPFHVVDVEISSPTPEANLDITPRLESLIETSPEPRSSMAPPEYVIQRQNKGGIYKLTAFLRRRRPPMFRPPISRAKGYSMTSIPTAETQLPPFKFGNGSSTLSTSVSMSLAEAFEQSPPQEKSVLRTSFMALGPQRPRQPFMGTACSSRGSGSPVSGHVRKTSNPPQRPRKMFRRSASMFEHPDDIMRQEKASVTSSGPLQAIMDIESAHILKLPHFTPEDQPDSLPRINQDTLLDIMDGKYSRAFDESVIIDCRFEYEYLGGHISSAVNFNDKDHLANTLFDAPISPRTLLIFHCEYSAHRAPIM